MTIAAITIGWWIIPAVISFLCLIWMFSILREDKGQDTYGLGSAMALFFSLFPLCIGLASWVIYSALCYWFS